MVRYILRDRLNGRRAAVCYFQYHAHTFRLLISLFLRYIFPTTSTPPYFLHSTIFWRNYYFQSILYIKSIHGFCHYLHYCIILIVSFWCANYFLFDDSWYGYCICQCSRISLYISWHIAVTVKCSRAYESDFSALSILIFIFIGEYTI